MVGRLGPDLGARGPTRGGTRPCGSGYALSLGHGAGLSSRCPEGAAAPGRRARNLGRSEQMGQHAERAAAPPPPAPSSPEERCPGPRSGSAASRAREGPRASPGLQGAPPLLRPGLRSRRSRGGRDGSGYLAARGPGAPRLCPSGSSGPRRSPGVPSRGRSRSGSLARRAAPGGRRACALGSARSEGARSRGC